jgi:hypothetical protein
VEHDPVATLRTRTGPRVPVAGDGRLLPGAGVGPRSPTWRSGWRPPGTGSRIAARSPGCPSWPPPRGRCAAGSSGCRWGPRAGRPACATGRAWRSATRRARTPSGRRSPRSSRRPTRRAPRASTSRSRAPVGVRPGAGRRAARSLDRRLRLPVRDNAPAHVEGSQNLQGRVRG